MQALAYSNKHGMYVYGTSFGRLERKDAPMCTGTAAATTDHTLTAALLKLKHTTVPRAHAVVKYLVIFELVRDVQGAQGVVLRV
eukprot:9310-Heterococcus_DN1.PRE.1